MGAKVCSGQMLNRHFPYRALGTMNEQGSSTIADPTLPGVQRWPSREQIGVNWIQEGGRLEAEVTGWVSSKVIGQGKMRTEELSAGQLHCVRGFSVLEWEGRGCRP